LAAGARIDDPDTTLQQSGVLPPEGGVIFRVIDIPPLPADPADAKRQAAAIFTRMFPDASHDTGSARSSGMHRTDTIDFAVVLSGELVAIMDEGETTMKAGDILIQRGTNHAWENRTNSMTRILFVLCDAKR
jgi:mannose-6-phosphate isomerase-like protein (cupin superfamily)